MNNMTAKYDGPPTTFDNVTCNAGAGEGIYVDGTELVVIENVRATTA